MNMRPIILAGAATAAVVLACHPVFFHDLEVQWSIGGSKSTSLCTTYNIQTWVVIAEGPEYRRREFPCNQTWDASNRFHEIEEGVYRVTMQALASGTGTVLAERKVEGINVFYDHPGPDVATVLFSATDFSGSGTARINLYWNINGTEDGLDLGKSWDTCAEVGADRAVIVVDNGAPVSTDCHANGQMSASVKVSDGVHNVKLKLVDKSGQDLTTTAVGDITATSTKAGEFIADYYYFSFLQGLKTTMTGTYWLTLGWGGGSDTCQVAKPPVSSVTVYLADSTQKAVTTDVCDESATCFKSNGASFGACQDKTKKYNIKGLTWGLYGARITGQATAGTGTEACYKKTAFADMDSKTDILVGAGTVNPVRAVTVPKDTTNTSTACNP